MAIYHQGVPVVNASRLIRKMSGGAQAHLLECDDGHFYVVKCVDNPQHRRVLVNEWLGSAFLTHLKITTPRTVFINVPEAFLEANPTLCFHRGTRCAQPETGWHFGSAYPGDPNHIAVLDFMPNSLLHRVLNLPEFLGVLVFDKWIANSDGRQSIFCRPRPTDFMFGENGRDVTRGFVAHMIDNGFAFGGADWSFMDSPLQGLHFQLSVYEKVRGLDDFQPWLDEITYFPEAVVDEACRQIPARWLAGDNKALEQLMLSLMRRRGKIERLLRDSRYGNGCNPFPNWL